LRRCLYRATHLACGCVVALAQLSYVRLSAARAQSADTIKKFETERHVGPAEEALVGLTVTLTTADGSTVVRHGNGIFVRCDGFVLAPESLFRLAQTRSSELPSDVAIVVVLHPGTDHEKLLSAHKPRISAILSVGDRWIRIPYIALKLDNIHAPAPRMLAPEALSEGDTLNILYSDWSEEKRRFLPVKSVPASRGRALAVSRDTITRFEAQYSLFAQSSPVVTNGAVIVGPKGLVVGLVTDPPSTGASQYANFDALDQVTDAVGALPCTDEQFAQLKQKAKPQDPGDADPNAVVQTEMVSIPGGPIRLPSLLKAYEADLENVYEACIPPYLIDRYEVTNAQYLDFWQSLPAAARKDSRIFEKYYPLGWGDESAPFPPALRSVPVLGVRLAGAQAYAKWAGKRLPNSLEWCLAAFGRLGGNSPPDWADKYFQARQTAWEKIVQAHIAYARQHPEVLPGFIVRRDITGDVTEIPDFTRPVLEEFIQIPWFFMRPGYAAACAWSHACVKQFTEPLFTDWVDPGYVLPVGSRKYDVSPYGVADMIMNARELVLPGLSSLWKKIPNDHWGYSGVDRYMEIDWVQGGLFTRPWRLAPATVWDTGLPKATERQILLDNGAAISNPDVIAQPDAFRNNNLLISHPAHSVDGAVAAVLMNPGVPFSGPDAPLNSINLPAAAEDDSKQIGLYHPVSSYAYRMPSRRIRSASQNAAFGDIFPSDLGDYVTVCSAVQEYSELLRPVNTCMLNLVAGPGFDAVYWASSGTWGVSGEFRINGPTASQRVGKMILRNNPVSDIGLNEWTADATCIGFTGAFADWSGGPDHYHVELGRPTAIDARYPLNSRGANGAGRRYAPDSFLIPGGFRCAR